MAAGPDAMFVVSDGLMIDDWLMGPVFARVGAIDRSASGPGAPAEVIAGRRSGPDREMGLCLCGRGLMIDGRLHLRPWPPALLENVLAGGHPLIDDLAIAPIFPR